MFRDIELPDPDFNPLDLSLWPKDSASYHAAAHVGSMIRSGMSMDDIHVQERIRHNSFRDSNRVWSRGKLLAADDFRFCVEKVLSDLGYAIPLEERFEEHRLVPVPKLAEPYFQIDSD